jgi:hypothetical protein
MAYRAKTALTRSKLRSAISNGKYVLRDIDHRGPEMRRLRDLVDDHVQQLGGPGTITHAERVLVNRCSMLTLLCEMREQGFAKQGMQVKATEADSYSKTVNTLRRCLLAIGLGQRLKQVPDLRDYIEGRAGGLEAAE